MQRAHKKLGLPGRRTAVMVLALAAVAVIALTGCSTGAYPVDFFQEMHYSPAVRKQEGPSMSVRPGTVAFNSGGAPEEQLNADLRLEHFDLMPDDELNGVEGNPIVVTPDVLEYGDFLFQRNCSMCHGAAGDGEGLLQVTIAFEAAGVEVPKNLMEDDTQARTAGDLYRIISRGNGDFPAPAWAENPSAWEGSTNMPRFAQLLSPAERWMLVAHIRTLEE